MGFFSSSKTPSSSQAEPSKSRWFSSKSSNKSSTTKTALQARPAAQGQLSSPAPLAARAPPPPKQPQPRLLPTLLPPNSSSDAGRSIDGRSFLGEASGSGSADVGRVAERLPAPPSRKGKGREDDATVLLANRLNELAVSNADGLLGDEDYRILRQEIFEQMSAAREQARIEARNAAAGGRGEMVNRENLRTPSSGRHPDRPPSAHSSQSGRSRLSNLGSLFSHKKSAHDLRSNRDSILSSGGGASSLQSSRLHGSGGVGDSSSLFSNGRSQRTSQDHGGVKTRTRQGQTEGGMSIRSGRTGYSSIHSTAEDARTGSIFRTASPPSAHGLRTLHAGGANGLPGADFTPAQLRAELASVEAEGQRLLAVFEGLAAKARAECSDYPGSLVTTTSPTPGSPLSDAAGEWEIIHHSPSLGSVSRMGDPAVAPNGGLKPALKKMSYSTPPSALNSQQHLRGRDSLSSLSGLSTPLQRRPSDGRTALPERPMLPPSFRGTSIDPEQAALQTRLADVERRRRDVQDRYERRLEFLRGKLRAAEIRERALR